VLVEDCRFEVPHKVRAPSSDGTDLDSCQDVTIRRCFYSVDDDCIVFKGTQGARALEFTEAPPVERVHIHDCVFDAGLGAIVFGTNATVVRDIRVENCDCSGDQPAVRLKLRPDTPGQHYERIHVRGLRLHERPPGIWHGGEIFYGAPPPLGPDQGGGPVDGVIVVVSPDHGPDMPPRLPGDIVRDLTIEKVTGTTRGFGDISAHPAIAVSNVTLRDIDVRLTDPELAPLIAKGVRNLKLENVRVNGAPPEVVR
jgi:alpha-L-rhamnosidase